MRRINLRAASLAAAAVGLVVAAAGCQANTSTDDTTDPWCGKKIGIFGAFSGPNAGLVLPARDGAKLAFKEYNEANPDCPLELVEYDTQGDPDQAGPFAQQVVADQDFLGVIGGHFSGETDATIPVYQGGGVTMISPSATRLDLTGRSGVTVFHRVVGHDGTQSAAIGKFLKDNDAQKVFLIDDGTAYGAGLTEELIKVLGSDVPYEADKIQEQQTQFDATVAKIVAAQPDYIFYAGYVREAAPLFRQIRAAAPCGCAGCLRSAARIVCLGEQVSVYTSNIYGSGSDAFEQASNMFANAERLLEQCGMAFSDVIRTWIYLREIDRDYDALNRARRQFFRDRGIERRPAS
ncbi:MAG: ABC transporter substrate-binding protein, partial [Alicyclobacillus shizuokensis]|nr:ABC transporter substrate-binding protein [Alicyclobacillus shizuokensis]